MHEITGTLSNYRINDNFYQFINTEVIPFTPLAAEKFWARLISLIEEFGPQNASLLTVRKDLQAKVDDWHKANPGTQNSDAYAAFLTDIGYITALPEEVAIATENVDEEISSLSGPQLIVPLKNARFTLNAANARWGSLYDALYGSDVIPRSKGLRAGTRYNPARGARVIDYAKDFLDKTFPLLEGSHHDVTGYLVYYQNLMVVLADGTSTGLANPPQFVAHSGPKSEPTSIALKNNGLHIECLFDRKQPVGARDLAGMFDIQVEAATTTIVDCEDLVAATNGEDKLEVYRNWLGLMCGNLTSMFDKSGKTVTRRAHPDKILTARDGEDYRLHGRSLLMIRNVGLLTNIDIIRTEGGQSVPEGILDAAITALIGSIDLQQQHRLRNSRTGSIYIVKPKLHGPDEVRFTCQLFSRVEQMIGLPANTLKLGIMDEERRTSLNLKACIEVARDRVISVNTGFLDRTGDEIHSCMHAGALLPKRLMAASDWYRTYEQHNVQTALACGFGGHAQIGKGMWPMPDEMRRMMLENSAQPLAGANTAWIPSPSAAVLHALHYHQIDVIAAQQRAQQETPVLRNQMLNIPLFADSEALTEDQVTRELDCTVHAVLGYVQPWIDAGDGCSRVADIDGLVTMEDRATLRISCQHVANWMLHGLCNRSQVKSSMIRMAEVIDARNESQIDYVNLWHGDQGSVAFEAAQTLIFEFANQPGGYPDLILALHREIARSRGTRAVAAA